MTITENEMEAQGEVAETDFAKLYEGSVKSLKEGELVTGTILQITKDNVIVDIGYKSEGQVRLREFLDSDGNPTIQIGDEVSVLLVRLEDKDGYIVLSKTRANQMKIWEDIEEAFKSSSNLAGTISQVVKGGYHVDINGVSAFLPNSQVDLKPVRVPEKLIGESYEFRVLKYNRRKINVIISRRAILEEERAKLREITLETIQEGAVVEGIVKNITDFGAFIDLGGIDGLVHLTDLSWGKVSHPSQILKTGDTINVKILKYNKDDGKIFLGYKQTIPDPWETVAEKYPVGSRVHGKVVNLTDYGAFVKVEGGIEGLVHISEMSWIKLRHPSQRLKVGEELDVMVLNIDVAGRRISLGLKQIEPNPWDDLEDKYPKGSIVKGVVKNVTDFGVFIGVEDNIDGLVHISDLSWKKVKHPSEVFKKGEEVEAVVLRVDKGSQRFSLSTKALESNPWDDVDSRYKPGMILDGRITSIADFGAFVEIEDGLEGLVHVSELNRGKKKGSTIEVGSLVEVEVLNVDADERKIGLSLRDVKEQPPQPTQPPDSVEAKEQGDEAAGDSADDDKGQAPEASGAEAADGDEVTAADTDKGQASTTDEEAPDKEASAEETKDEETPAEETKDEETPAKETKDEETPAEETKDEETPAKETKDEETPDEKT